MPRTRGDSDTVMLDQVSTEGEVSRTDSSSRVFDSAAFFPLAVVILARDEAEVIGRSLASIRPQLQPGDCMHVVADHCRDETEFAARRAGAWVHLRRSGKPGKGQALAWWVRHLDKLGRKPAGIVIIDADSIAAPRSLEFLRRKLIEGQRVVQARVAPLLETEDPVSTLAALSEEIEQRVFNRLRIFIGAPVRLRGTGMAFHTEVLSRAVSCLQTSVEDAELSLIMMDMGFKPESVSQSIIYDPKPVDGAAASRQRARWLQGHWQLVKEQPGLLLRVARRGPVGWSLLASLYLKPRILLLPLLFILAAVGLLVAVQWNLLWLSWLLLLPLAFNLTGLLLGLALAPAELRQATLRALPRSHRFLTMWLRSYRLARHSQDPWLRARARVTDRRVGEATSTGQ